VGARAGRVVEVHRRRVELEGETVRQGGGRRRRHSVDRVRWPALARHEEKI
jgi:hypothetical protein